MRRSPGRIAGLEEHHPKVKARNKSEINASSGRRDGNFTHEQSL
jgi:hypothetical protein